MIAKLFDANNKFLRETDVPEGIPILPLRRETWYPVRGTTPPVSETQTFRLVDTDESGALIYREFDDKTTAAVEKSSARPEVGMKTKLFDANDNFMRATNVDELFPTLVLPKNISRLGPGMGDQPPVEMTTFRLVGGDKDGFLNYREAGEKVPE